MPEAIDHTSPSTFRGSRLSVPSIASTQEQTRRRTRKNEMADALENLGASYIQAQRMRDARSQSLPLPPAWAEMKEALSKLQEDPDITGRDVMDAIVLFKDGEKAVIFCSLQPVHRRTWLEQELQLLRNAP
jgi:hypothetical protein